MPDQFRNKRYCLRDCLVNIAEAQLIRQLLARVQALEFAVAELETRTGPTEIETDANGYVTAIVPVKRKPGRPRKQQ